MSKFGLAAVCDSPNTPLELREYGVRDVEADEVLVRVKTAVDPRGILNPGKLGLRWNEVEEESE